MPQSISKELPPYAFLMVARLCLSVGVLVWIGSYANASDTRRNRNELNLEEAKAFWAFQKPRLQSPQSNGDWGINRIDAYIFETLKENGLSPSLPASKRDLIRRATYDLHGLPPPPEAIDAFLRDESPEAYERLIDRLLASPRYGEKWGQHWLDVIRFSESEGFEYDRHLPGAWRFRDYVIRSFNEDRPFDAFIRDQLAGDEFEDPSEDALIASGFHRFGPVRRNAGNPEIALSRNEVLTERTDIIGTAFLGLTMGCARCHEHKLDPITQEDYYSLQAFVASTQERNRYIGPADEIAAWEEEVEAANKEIYELRLRSDEGDVTKEEKKRISERIGELKKKLEPRWPAILSTENDPELRTEIRVLKRGVWELKGDPVEMRVPAVLMGEATPTYPLDYERPRTALADWLVSPENPLTARVVVNRVWLNHFGSGIVNTPNDFGAHGERPSHPELLDYLAIEFKRSGWSLKALHRSIMTSATYRQSSRTKTTERAFEVDPANRFLWKFNRRRLQAEEIRDSLLAVSGKLNTEMYVESVMLSVDPSMVELLYDPKQWQPTEDASQRDRRSVYLMAKRNLRLPFMESFDQPTLQSSCGRRESSTHAPQALELLNGEIANDMAEAFAQRLIEERGNDSKQSIERAWMLAMGRLPSESEYAFSESFLESNPLREFCIALFNLNDFLYVH